MSNKVREAQRIAGLAVAMIAFIIGVAGVAVAAEETFVANGYGVSGYDPVAYHVDGKPVDGKDQFTSTYNGTTYRFSSQVNRDAFLGNPEAYAPAYGGFCAFGTAMGRKFPGDPNAWRIVDGTLYLNLNKDVQKRWVTDIPGFIKGAENNWPIIQAVADAKLEANPLAGLTLGAQ